jgi:hypothetical protein
MCMQRSMSGLPLRRMIGPGNIVERCLPTARSSIGPKPGQWDGSRGESADLGYGPPRSVHGPQLPVAPVRALFDRAPDSNFRAPCAYTCKIADEKTPEAMVTVNASVITSQTAGDRRSRTFSEEL